MSRRGSSGYTPQLSTAVMYVRGRRQRAARRRLPRAVLRWRAIRPRPGRRSWSGALDGEPVRIPGPGRAARREPDLRRRRRRRRSRPPTSRRPTEPTTDGAADHAGADRRRPSRRRPPEPTDARRADRPRSRPTDGAATRRTCRRRRAQPAPGAPRRRGQRRGRSAAGCRRSVLTRRPMRQPWRCVAYLVSRRRTSDDVVAPTLADPLARAAHGPDRWPARAARRPAPAGGRRCGSRCCVATITLRSGRGAEVAVRGRPTVGDVAKPYAFSHMCYSDIQYLYAGPRSRRGHLPVQPTRRPAAEARSRTRPPRSTSSRSSTRC